MLDGQRAIFPGTTPFFNAWKPDSLSEKRVSYRRTFERCQVCMMWGWPSVTQECVALYSAFGANASNLVIPRCRVGSHQMCVQIQLYHCILGRQPQWCGCPMPGTLLILSLDCLTGLIADFPGIISATRECTGNHGCIVNVYVMKEYSHSYCQYLDIQLLLGVSY